MDFYPYRKIEPDQLNANEFIGIRSFELHQFSLDANKEIFQNQFVACHPVTFLPPEKTVDAKTKKEKLIYRDHNAHR